MLDGEQGLLAFSKVVPKADERRSVYVAHADKAEDVGTDVLGKGTFDYLEAEGVRVEPEFHLLRALERRIAEAQARTAWQRGELDGC